MESSLLREAWHTAILTRIGRIISQHIREGRTALQVSYMLAQDCYFLATPEETAALHVWYGGTKTEVVIGLLQDAGAIVGINTRGIKLVSLESSIKEIAR